MAKERIYELAKRLGVENKELVRFLSEAGAAVKSNLSTVEPEFVQKAVAKYQPAKGATAAKRAKDPAAGGGRKRAAPQSGAEAAPKTKAAPKEKAREGAQGAAKGGGTAPRGQSPGRNAQAAGRPAAGRGAEGRGARNGPRAASRRQGQPQRPAERDGGRSGRPSRKVITSGRPAAHNTETRRESVGKRREAPSNNNQRRQRRGGRPQGRQDRPMRGGNRNGRGRRPAPAKRPPSPPVKPRGGKVEIPESLTVRELAGKLGVAAGSIIKQLMSAGVMATINDRIEHDAAALVAAEYGFEVTSPKSVEQILQDQVPDANPERQVTRPPVVTIMGHVDHGKTSLLDTIRKTRVATGEAGGITQHIGAYQIAFNGRPITFLDTPGHEAFTAMRSRGTQVTDVVVLVVAADDGVMPQTVEAINHAQAAEVPIIVAVNKIDRPGANADRVKQQLTEHGLVPEAWGGETICVEVSAVQETGIDELLEMILLVAEVAELKANPELPATGTVVEAKLDKGRGPVATILVRNGNLRVGDSVLAGPVLGRIRAMISDRGESVEHAGPSTPVEILGLPEVPQAGEPFQVVKDDRTARVVAGVRQEQERANALHPSSRMTLDQLFNQIQEGDVKELPVVIKADVQGSVEALKSSLEQLTNNEVRVRVIHAATGGVRETDVNLAAASRAVIIGFNVRPDVNARRAAEREHVEVNLYRVIYEAIDDVKSSLAGLREPTYRESVLGQAEVRATFKVPGVGTIGGCYVREGKVLRTAKVRLLRDHVVIHEGKVSSLKRFKDDVKEVTSGYECGIGIDNFNDVKEGDVIEAFEIEEVKAEV